MITVLVYGPKSFSVQLYSGDEPSFDVSSEDQKNIDGLAPYDFNGAVTGNKHVCYGPRGRRIIENVSLNAGAFANDIESAIDSIFSKHRIRACDGRIKRLEEKLAVERERKQRLLSRSTERIFDILSGEEIV